MANTTRPTVTPDLPAYPALQGANYNPAFGGTPATPNPLATAKEAATGNLALLPDLKKLGYQTNEKLENQYTRRLPGYDQMAATSSGNIQSLLQGQIPDDVRMLIEQNAAERGAGRGMSGADIGNLDYLRALGLTSLDLQGKGEAGFTGAMNRVNQIPFFDFSKFFVTPEQEQEAAVAASNIASAPNPAAASAEEKRNLLQGLGVGTGTGTGAPASIDWNTPAPGAGSKYYDAMNHTYIY